MKTFIKKMLKKEVILFFTCLLFVQHTFAQERREVKGQIISATDGSPIPFASVLIKNTKEGAVTDFDGKFSVKAATNEMLVFSYVGYKTVEKIANSPSLTITLVEDVATLDEVVIVGYGSQQKKDLTGAISVIRPEELQKKQVTTVAEGLQGLVTGVKVRGGGQPGQEANIEIRGLKNLSGTNPLYVIDGLITTANRDFNPNDIESIQVLKDASAAAIYGSRAANGVIIITTKKGKKGPLKVDISMKTSFSSIPKYNLANTEEFSKLNFQAYDNGGLTRQRLNLDVNTDWQKAVFQSGMIRDYNASVSGGGDNSTFFMSGNYFGNKGTIVSTDFDRLSFRVNTSGTRGIFSIGENVAISDSKTDEMSGNPLVDVFRMTPTIPLYDARNPGGFGYGESDVADTFGTNPLAIAKLLDATSQNTRIRGNIWTEIKPFSFLKYRFNFGYEASFDSYKQVRKTGNWTLNQPNDPSFSFQNRAKSQSLLYENTLSFDKTFGKHNIKALAGITYQKEEYEQINGRKFHLLTNPSSGEYFDVLDLGDQAQTGGFFNEASLASYLARVEYNYADRYLLNAVIRRDGSSRFSSANKWGNFPSVSAGWRISKESFFESSIVSDFKLRASYGELGSGNIGNYDYQGFINTFGAVVLGNAQTLYPNATQVKLANPDLHWERLKQTNFGFDFAVLNNSLRLTGDYYIAKTEDVLFGIPILMSTGNDGGNPVSNAASVQNNGLELELAYQKTYGDFSFNAAVNFSKVDNKLLSFGNGQDQFYSGNTITEAGKAVGMWYVLQTDGLFQNAQEVADYKSSNGTVILPNAQPGDIRFKDVNDDGKITNEDKAVVGSPWPKFEMGLNVGCDYKGFDFSMNWIGSHGATVYNGYRSVVDKFDDNSNYRAGVQPWTPENPNTDFPRIVKGTTLNSRGDSDRFLENGDFIRLKYIGIGYNLPKDAIQRIGLNKARFSFSAQNIVTITKYQGLDPEFSNGNIFERGFDYGAFPNLRTYSFGVEFGF